MKRLIFLLNLIIATTAINAQSYLIESFELSATRKIYGIYTDIDSGESSTSCLYYDMQAPNDEQEVQARINFGIRTASNNIDSFKKAFIKAKEKYIEWKQIAQTNSLVLLSKRIPAHVSDQNLYFTENGKWYSERGVDMWFTFYVNKDGLCFLILESDDMTSNEIVSHTSSIGVSFAGYFSQHPLMGIGTSSNTVTIERYCSGASLTFSSEEEIDDFIQKIENVVVWKRNNVSNGKLLK